jgi:hypothetical protein
MYSQRCASPPSLMRTIRFDNWSLSLCSQRVSNIGNSARLDRHHVLVCCAADQGRCFVSDGQRRLPRAGRSPCGPVATVHGPRVRYPLRSATQAYWRERSNECQRFKRDLTSFVSSCERMFAKKWPRKMRLPALRQANIMSNRDRGFHPAGQQILIELSQRIILRGAGLRPRS